MSNFLKFLISVVIAASLLITPQLCIACNTFLSIGNWNNSVLWSSCSGAGGLPGSSDDAQIFFYLL